MIFNPCANKIFDKKENIRHCIQIEWSFGSNSKMCPIVLKPKQELITNFKKQTRIP